MYVDIFQSKNVYMLLYIFAELVLILKGKIILLVPKSNIKFEAVKKLWFKNYFLQGFVILVPSVKPWKTVIFQLSMVTFASSPLVLITNMV